MTLRSLVFAGSLFLMPACAIGQTAAPAPVPVRNILYARPFTLEKPYRSDWSKERAIVSSGVLVVLEVDPKLVVPRDSLEPVLYAGDVTVQRLNHGYPSGHVIGIIPGNVDLATTPFWFGAPELPERVTQEMVRAERALAERAEVHPFSAKKLAGVTHPAAGASDLAALLRNVVAQLVEQYSPEDKYLAIAWRLPVAKAPPAGRKP